MTQPLKAIDTPNGRVYELSPNFYYPSITNVLAVMEKGHLSKWGAKIASNIVALDFDKLAAMKPADRATYIKASAEHEMSAAAKLGDAVHAAVEARINGEIIEVDKQVKPFMNQFENFIDHHKPEFTWTETTLVNHDYKYAGTGDFGCVIDGKLWTVDAKTGSRLNSDGTLQLNALANCAETIDGVKVSRPEKLGLLHLRPRKWELREVEDSMDSFDVFTSCLRLWNYRVAQGDVWKDSWS